jgi:hypothetical protein
MPVSKGWQTMPRRSCLPPHQLVATQTSDGTADNAVPLPLLLFEPLPLPLPSVYAAAIVAIREQARDG